MSSFEVMITVNSPGEVSGWLRPAVAALRACPDIGPITVFVPPCTFASGAECSVAGSVPGVDMVVGPREFLRFVLWGRRPRGFTPSPPGIVLFLGGDLAYAALLARRLRYPACAYTEGRAAWVSSFDFFALPYENMREKLLDRGLPPDKIKVIGNLMLDAPSPRMNSAEVRRLLDIGDRPFILLLPGSRPAHVAHMAPLFLEAASFIRAAAPEAAFVMGISPFVDDETLRAAMANPDSFLSGRSCGYSPGGIDPADGATDWRRPGLLRAWEGTVLPALRGRQYDLMGAADLALTLPGTNTMELACLGVPMIVALQLAFPEKIPLEGLPGLLGGIPIAGPALKRLALPRILAKMPLTAWPNRLADESIVPELRGRLDPVLLGQAVLELLSDQERQTLIRDRLRQVVGAHGAATRLARLVLDAAASRLRSREKE